MNIKVKKDDGATWLYHKEKVMVGSGKKGSPRTGVWNFYYGPAELFDPCASSNKEDSAISPAWMVCAINVILFMNPIIMTNAVVNHHPLLVWDMPGSIQGKSDKAWNLYRGIIAADNAVYFTPQPIAPAPTPAMMLGFLTDYDTAITDVKTHTQTPQERDAAWTVLYQQGVKSWIYYAQQICIKHPEWAESIASVLKLTLKAPSISDKEDFTATYLRLGTVELVGRLKKTKCLFDWQGTTDPTKGWTDLDIPPSFECKTTVEGLAEGTWYFRMRKCYTKHRVDAWSNAVDVYVKNH